jgi:hypothetical protein
MQLMLSKRARVDANAAARRANADAASVAVESFAEFNALSETARAAMTGMRLPRSRKSSVSEGGGAAVQQVADDTVAVVDVVDDAADGNVGGKGGGDASMLRLERSHTRGVFYDQTLLLSYGASAPSAMRFAAAVADNAPIIEAPPSNALHQRTSSSSSSSSSSYSSSSSATSEEIARSAAVATAAAGAARPPHLSARLAGLHRIPDVTDPTDVSASQLHMELEYLAALRGGIFSFKGSLRRIRRLERRGLKRMRRITGGRPHSAPPTKVAHLVAKGGDRAVQATLRGVGIGVFASDKLDDTFGDSNDVDEKRDDDDDDDGGDGGGLSESDSDADSDDSTSSLENMRVALRGDLDMLIEEEESDDDESSNNSGDDDDADGSKTKAAAIRAAAKAEAKAAADARRTLRADRQQKRAAERKLKRVQRALRLHWRGEKERIASLHTGLQLCK